MITAIYSAIGLERHPADRSADEPPADPSRLDVAVHADLGHAVLTVHRVGGDLGPAVAERLTSIRRGGIDVAYLDLPLDDPATPWATTQLAPLGFGFAGVVPLLHGGVDVVRYQSLGGVPVDPDRIKLRNGFTRDLLDYVLKEQP